MARLTCEILVKLVFVYLAFREELTSLHKQARILLSQDTKPNSHKLFNKRVWQLVIVGELKTTLRNLVAGELLGKFWCDK